MLRSLVAQHVARSMHARSANRWHPTGQGVADRSRLAACLALLLLLSLVAYTVPAQAQSSVVRLYYFYDPDCSICAETHREVLEPLLTAYGERLVVDERSIAEAADFELLLDLEQRLGVLSGGIPEVVIGQEVLIGPDEIRVRLQERIEHYLAQGGVELPTIAAVVAPTVTSAVAWAAEVVATPLPQPSASPTSAGVALPPIHMAYFYQPGCDICARAEHDLQYVVDRYPQVKVRRFNAKEETALSQYLCARAGVPEDKYLTAPMVFVGSGYVGADEMGGRALEALVQPYVETGAAEPWAGFDAQKAAAEGQIVERFRSLSLLTVVGAGLLDGVNPCAFATMIFLVSYLAVRKRKGRELLATGAAFTLGVFLTYLGVGLGFLRFLASLPGLATVGRWLNGITMLLCLGLAVGSFVDYRKAREGRLEDMSLKLPERMRGWSRRLIREGSAATSFVLASFLLGMVVSLIELACTGQVYLPTIVFVLGVPGWRTMATLALVTYNVMFIVPLVVVFLVVYFGTTSQQLLRWMTRRTAAIKLGTVILFVLLAVWLGYGVIAG